jgi:tRNA A37 threonylcarbamoyladenosine synthetase subunit TsaC/SUA5/YrdC
MIEDKFNSLVDIVIDGGIGSILPSTVVDCTGDEPVVIRKGLGEFSQGPEY